MACQHSTSSNTRVAIAIRDLGKNSGTCRNVQEHCRIFRDIEVPVDVYAERFNRQLVDLSDAAFHRIRRWPLNRANRRASFDSRVRRQVQKTPGTLLFSHGDVRTQDVLSIHNCVHREHELLTGTSLPANDPLGAIHEELITEPNLSLLLANSHVMASDLIDRFSLNPDRVRVLYPSYSSDVFNTHSHDALRTRGRQRLGIPEHQKLAGLVTSGNFRKRNVTGLLRAASLCSPQIHWLIVGKGSHQNDYKKLAQDLGISERVHFASVIPEVECYYHALDIFVLPALIEEFGRSALEAMACATPVVLGPNVGCSELIQDADENAVLRDVSPETIAHTIDMLLGAPDSLENLAQTGARIAPQYSEQRQAYRLLETLSSFFPGYFPRSVIERAPP